MEEGYFVEFEPAAVKDLAKADPSKGQRILDKISWMSAHFDQLKHQALTGISKGFLKLRVGDYRIIYTVNQEQRIITIHLIGHRREIYR